MRTPYSPPSFRFAPVGGGFQLAQVDGLQELLAAMGEHEATVTPFNLFALLEPIGEGLRSALDALGQGPYKV